VRPRTGGMRTEPGRRWAVTILAGDTFGDFECAAALLGRRIQCVTRQALRGFFGLRAEFQNPRHAFADVSGQCLVGAAVLVLDDPGRIFVLENATAGDRLYAAMAACGRAGAGADVFDGFVLSDKHVWYGQKPCAEDNAKDAEVGEFAHSVCRRICLLISFAAR
jgi:hypothetical protein